MKESADQRDDKQNSLSGTYPSSDPLRISSTCSFRRIFFQIRNALRTSFPVWVDCLPVSLFSFVDYERKLREVLSHRIILFSSNFITIHFSLVRAWPFILTALFSLDVQMFVQTSSHYFSSHPILAWKSPFPLVEIKWRIFRDYSREEKEGNMWLVAHADWLASYKIPVGSWLSPSSYAIERQKHCFSRYFKANIWIGEILWYCQMRRFSPLCRIELLCW